MDLKALEDSNRQNFMKDSILKAVLLDCKKQEAHAIEIKDNLESYYNLVGTDIIDVVTRKINGKAYDVICDEEGLFKHDCVISAINAQGRFQLVNSLVIVGCSDSEGCETSLKDEDVNAIMHKIYRIKTVMHPEGLLVLECE